MLDLILGVILLAAFCFLIYYYFPVIWGVLISIFPLPHGNVALVLENVTFYLLMLFPFLIVLKTTRSFPLKAICIVGVVVLLGLSFVYIRNEWSMVSSGLMRSLPSFDFLRR